MHPYRFTISLRITHPYLSLEQILKDIGGTPKFGWSVGEPWRTPKGALLLGGMREETYYCRWIQDWVVGDVEESISQHVEALAPHVSLFNSYADEGGTVEFFIGLILTSNAGFEISPSVSRQLAKMRISLAFDLYSENVFVHGEKARHGAPAKPEQAELG